ncbi:hypothetical protein [Arthrobacter bussei]|uniref:Uncharacterized protein n=1 Tax=Arthrobacter bussei TaxID=2594179 RepID=A0A7X1NS23_9MICC|nr:hypothetical protein [Arthrobacter bussei]MPY11986.1 hypothetical protein [Arthrobacter bussei]
MTEPSSSAGHPDGATLPAEHPLGPAAPVPPREKESAAPSHADAPTPGHEAGAPLQADAAAAVDDAGVGEGSAGSGNDGGGNDGRPDADRREAVLDPSAGGSTHRSASIRDEQGTHSAGTVPAAFNGDGTPDDPADDGRPEDAAAEPDRWDSGGSAG